jgi:uncharacterized membrane protein
VRRSNTFSTSVLWAVLGRLLLSISATATAFLLILTDSNCHSQLWPQDIHLQIVRVLGGTMRTTALGDQSVALSVFTLAAWLGAATLFAVAWQARGFAKQQRQQPFHANGRHGWLFSLRHVESGLRPAGLCSAAWLMIWLASSLQASGILLSLLVATVPLSFGAMLALFLHGLLPTADHALAPVASPQTPDTETAQAIPQRLWRTWQFAIVVLAALLWQSVSFWQNTRLYSELMVPHGDSAMYEEHLWNLWHGKGFRSYLDQGLFLGEHIQVIHLLLLPLHILWPSYLMMEWVASACLAFCVVPIFRLTTVRTGSTTAAMWLALAWLLFFPMHFLDIAIDLKTLRPSCYGLPFLFLGIDYAERRRTKAAGVCLLIALLTQEDFALVTGSIGLVLFLQSWLQQPSDTSRAFQRWSLGVFVGSVLWVLLAVLVVIPAFRGGEVVHYSRYFGDLGSSPGELIRTALTAPGRVAAMLFSQRTLLYLLVLTVPLGLLPWRRPLILSAGLVTFIMLSLIQLGNDSPGSAPGGTELPPIPYHHFHAPLLPILFWAAIAALAPSLRVRSGPSKTTTAPGEDLKSSFTAEPSVSRAASRARLACFCAATTALTGSLMPCGTTFWSTQSAYGRTQLYAATERGAMLERVLAKIPPTSRVASTDYVHTRLTHYERSYDYSDYLRAVNQYRPGVPDDTDYIVIDTTHRYSQIRSPADVRELREQPERWELLPDETQGMFLVLKRRPLNNP